MENAFFVTPVNNRPEAIRWISLAETMLMNRDWMACRRCAVRAREIDSRIGRVVDEIVVIADTLLAGERRTVTNQRDWYAILGLTPLQGRNMELVSSRYHNLVYILNPQRNRFPFAAQAFSMVSDAWYVLFDPMRKSLYDRELGLYMQSPSLPLPPPSLVHDPRLAVQANFRLYGQCSTQLPPPMHVGGGSITGVGEHALVNAQVPWVESQQIISSTTHCNLSDHAESFPWSGLINDPIKEGSSTSAGTVASAHVVNKEELYGLQNQPHQNHSDVCNVEKSAKDTKEAGEKRPDSAKLSKEGSTFWTVCPYCFYVYEYFDTYVNRAMICQACRKTFHAVEIESPPQAVEGQEAYYACWGSMPFGVSIETWNNRNITGNTNAPVAPQVGNVVNEGVCGVGNLASSSKANVDDKLKMIVEILDSSTDEEEKNDDDSRKRKKLCVGENDKPNVENAVESSNGVAQKNVVGQVADQVLTDKFMPDFGSNFDTEVFDKFEEPGVGTSKGSGEDDAMDGHALFEGLDEFLSTLPAVTEDETN